MDTLLQTLLIWCIVVMLGSLLQAPPEWFMTFSFLLGFFYQPVNNFLSYSDDNDEEDPFY